MISNENLINIKVVEVMKIYNFYFVILSFDKIWTFQIWNFEKREMGTTGAAGDWTAPTVPICRFTKFQIWKIQILSNDKMTKIKVVDINELNKFYIHHFLCWNHFGSQILVRTCYFLKFQIWKVQILSNDKMTKIKVVDLHDLYNFDFSS